MYYKEAIESIERGKLFRKEGNVYIKTYKYIVDMLVDRVCKYYNLQKIEVNEEEMSIYSPLYGEKPVIFKYADMNEFYLISSVF